jgi:hypothetical protein
MSDEPLARERDRQLCAEHDRLMAEHHEWMTQREAAGAAPVQKSGDGPMGMAQRRPPRADGAPARMMGGERDRDQRTGQGFGLYSAPAGRRGRRIGPSRCGSPQYGPKR